ncbi:pirin family protein [Sandaracinobacter sp. RS1-74]|uniref:pirin family protein n=1 Tax=Sandaracinobacteroides sayramensis TaxID=2913411 RepID=UPI001EDB6F73|nr:pirin family protein [Sandaracinobacteroides sayramensis]MCG2841532.1 pirin family protein [Sandaracinobacteroides sayramensis]
MQKAIIGRYGNNRGHWVGDGFPVRSLFSYSNEGSTLGSRISPFLLLDYGGPWLFEPTEDRRGVGQHPHRGFETVTIVYDGEVEHRDSTGNGGIIGPGDVQWMTAASGILHEEFHSPGFARTGGPFRMVQLWVNLPAKDKMAPAGYQAILSSQIPVVQLPEGKGHVRIIAGKFGGDKGPARTFTPINMWDMRVKGDADVTLDLPEGHMALLVVLGGHISLEGGQTVGEAEVLHLSTEGDSVSFHADGDTTLLVLTGEPIDEPIVGYGPFVMNSEAEIQKAVSDYQNGRLAN